MVFIFIWFTFHTSSFPPRTELCFDRVIVRPAVPPRRLPINGLSSGPPRSRFLLPPSRRHRAPFSIPRFFLAGSILPCCSRVIFYSDSQSHHFLQILHLKTDLMQKTFPEWKLPLQRESDELENYTQRFRPSPSSASLCSLEHPRSYFALVSLSLPVSLGCQFLSNCFAICNHGSYFQLHYIYPHFPCDEVHFRGAFFWLSKRKAPGRLYCFDQCFSSCTQLFCESPPISFNQLFVECLFL